MVLWKKMHEVRMRYLASDVHVDVLVMLECQGKKLGSQKREKLLSSMR